MCTFGLVEFGSSEKSEICLFLQNVRPKLKDIMMVDGCGHAPLPNSARKYNLALY